MANFGNNAGSRFPPPCDCLKLAKLRISWTRDNPGRRFWNCANSLLNTTQKCRWFSWVDGQLNDEYYKEMLYNLRLNQRVNNQYVQQHLDDEARINELEVRLAGEKHVTETLQMELVMRKDQLGLLERKFNGFKKWMLGVCVCLVVFVMLKVG